MSKLASFYLKLDLRSLGLFRILIGAVLLLDWLHRWPHIEAFYTAAGVFSGVERPTGPFSLLESFRTVEQAQLFFLFAAGCYVLFLVGFRTRLFHALSFLCFVSILNRNTLVRAGDDLVMATMLLWTLFLPLGARFSVDALRSGRRAPADNLSGYSIAAFCAVAQIGLIYFCTAFAKSGLSWRDGTAIYYALHLDQLTRGFGHLVAQWPMYILKPLTWGTLAVEYLALPMILCPFLQPYLRRTIIVALGALHIGIALTMTLELFALKMMVTFVLLLRGEDWALLSQAASRVAARPPVRSAVERAAGWRSRYWEPVAGYFGVNVGANEAPRGLEAGTSLAHTAGIEPAEVERSFRAAGPNAAPGRRLVSRGAYGAVQAVVVVLFAAILIESYNANLRRRLETEPIPQWSVARSFLLRMQLVQRWDLFAPNPTRDDGWWVVAGVTESGRRLDPLTGREPSFAKPAGSGRAHAPALAEIYVAAATRAERAPAAGIGALYHPAESPDVAGGRAAGAVPDLSGARADPRAGRDAAVSRQSHATALVGLLRQAAAAAGAGAADNRFTAPAGACGAGHVARRFPAADCSRRCPHKSVATSGSATNRRKIQRPIRPVRVFGAAPKSASKASGHEKAQERSTTSRGRLFAWKLAGTTTFPGICFGLLREATGSVAPGIALHFLNNFFGSPC
jgi:hypothetical protein